MQRVVENVKNEINDLIAQITEHLQNIDRELASEDISRKAILSQKKNVLDCALYLLFGKTTHEHLHKAMSLNPDYTDKRFFQIEDIVNKAIEIIPVKFSNWNKYIDGKNQTKFFKGGPLDCFKLKGFFGESSSVEYITDDEKKSLHLTFMYGGGFVLDLRVVGMDSTVSKTLEDKFPLRKDWYCRYYKRKGEGINLSLHPLDDGSLDPETELYQNLARFNTKVIYEPERIIEVLTTLAEFVTFPKEMIVDINATIASYIQTQKNHMQALTISLIKGNHEIINNLQQLLVYGSERSSTTNEEYQIKSALDKALYSTYEADIASRWIVSLIKENKLGEAILWCSTFVASHPLSENILSLISENRYSEKHFIAVKNQSLSKLNLASKLISQIIKNTGNPESQVWFLLDQVPALLSCQEALFKSAYNISQLTSLADDINSSMDLLDQLSGSPVFTEKPTTPIAESYLLILQMREIKALRQELCQLKEADSLNQKKSNGLNNNLGFFIPPIQQITKMEGAAVAKPAQQNASGQSHHIQLKKS